MKRITQTDLQVLSKIMAKENPEAYERGYRDGETAAKVELLDLQKRISDLEYQNKHLTNYVHRGEHLPA